MRALKISFSVFSRIWVVFGFTACFTLLICPFTGYFLGYRSEPFLAVFRDTDTYKLGIVPATLLIPTSVAYGVVAFFRPNGPAKLIAYFLVMALIVGLLIFIEIATRDNELSGLFWGLAIWVFVLGCLSSIFQHWHPKSQVRPILALPTILFLSIYLYFRWPYI
jgi:hypothetical protein